MEKSFLVRLFLFELIDHCTLLQFTVLNIHWNDVTIYRTSIVQPTIYMHTPTTLQMAQKFTINLQTLFTVAVEAVAVVVVINRNSILYIQKQGRAHFFAPTKYQSVS